MTTCARNRNVRELPPRKPHSPHRHRPFFAAHRESPMLVNSPRFLRDDAAGSGALLLLALLAGALHAAPQLLQVGGDDEVSASLIVARRGSGRRRDNPLNPQFFLVLRVLNGDVPKISVHSRYGFNVLARNIWRPRECASVQRRAEMRHCSRGVGDHATKQVFKFTFRQARDKLVHVATV